MMEVLFYPYWNLAFIPGVFLFCLATFFLILALTDPLKDQSSTGFISTFYKFFNSKLIYNLY